MTIIAVLVLNWQHARVEHLPKLVKMVDEYT
jgi:hypothetical protein